MTEARADTRQSKSAANKVTNISRTVFGTFGMLNGREVEFNRAMRMWHYTDGSGYAYGAQS